MRDRWPIYFALTVSSLAVLATGVAAGLALSLGTQPAAFGLGIAGMLAASLGLLAIIRWMLDADEVYPDYRYRSAVAAGPSAFAIAPHANDRRQLQIPRRPQPVRPQSFGDNVVVFDPTRARQKNQRAL